MNKPIRKLLIIFILLPFPFILGSNTQKYNYREVFADDYQFALQYVEQHKSEITAISAGFNTKASIVVSMAFPELIRFSRFRNMIELAALEILYVSYGPSAADFSTGPWQIKPSAVEQLEKFFSDSIVPNDKWAYLFHYKNTDEAGIRKERLARLKNDRWQMIYLSAFCMAIQHKFQLIDFKNEACQVSFYATAYNHGFNCTDDEIRNWENAAFFPNGIKSKTKQYSYSDIAVDFFNHYCNKYFK